MVSRCWGRIVEAKENRGSGKRDSEEKVRLKERGREMKKKKKEGRSRKKGLNICTSSSLKLFQDIIKSSRL